MPSWDSSRHNWPLVLTGCFAMLWMVHRALVQSIVFDEANTFLGYVAPGWAAVWYPSSNNHVLNSILIRLLVQGFCLSHLTMRGPALFGGALYIVAAYRACTLLSREVALTWPLFVCLVYNPFVMDYLVAARGYGLALGFLILAACVTVQMLLRRDQAREREILVDASVVSCCAGLSFCANFSFAYVNAGLLIVVFAWACHRTGIVRLIAACVVPAAGLALVLTGPVLIHFPKGELYWGTHSLKEMWRYIQLESFPELNPYLVPAVLARVLEAVQPHLVRAAVELVALYLALLLIRKSRDLELQSRLRVAASFTTVLGIALLAHWLQFQWFKVPLPLDRTSLFIVPILMIGLGAVFSVAPAMALARAVRGLGIGILFIAAAYFLGSLRDSHFQEWKTYGADVKAAFPTIVDLSRRAGVDQVPADWKYVPSLNFYRILYAATSLAEFQTLEQIPRGKPIYVLPENEFKEFIRTEGLQIAYRGAISDLVIAVR